MHPLNVTGMARVVPVQGVEVAGQHLPVGVSNASTKFGHLAFD